MRHLIKASLAGLTVLMGVAAVASVETPDSFPGVGLQRVHDGLRFERPVFLTGAGDGSGRIFVVEQDGIIRVVDGWEAPGTPGVFLDIREHVSRRGNEEGLLGLAFHPDFAKNGQFFVHFSSKRDADDQGVARNVISRVTVSKDDPSRADFATEEVLLRQRQPFRNHNGGMIAFGPDGMLYVSFGDGGAANDPEGNGQKLSSMLGSIVRLDVDTTSGDLAYGVPQDNPFVEVEGARPELWAIGLRNVWRFSFDRATGALYAGEVGQNTTEEVDLIVRGGNYGWNRFEAGAVFRDGTELIHGDHIEPIATYPRSEGISITGGYVYRGTLHPELQGLYFFGDYVSGNLWATRASGEGEYETELVRRTGRSIASFGEDDDGELYLLSFDGAVYRVVATDEPEASLAHWPSKLSETGLYASMKSRELAADLVPYEVNAPFWSDFALKGRYLDLPEGTALGYRAEGTWEVPVGTRVIKTFDAAPSGRRKTPRPIETRVIERTEDGWEAATYVWDRRGKEAELLPSGMQFEQYSTRGVTTWHAPSSSECASCHVGEAGYLLGLTTAQLNHRDDAGHQIQRWIEAGVVEAPASWDAASAPRMVDPADEAAPLEDRARAYLEVNCAMCHRPNGPANASVDLRMGIPLREMGLVGVAPTQGDFGLLDPMLVSPGEPASSVLLHRIMTLGAGRMPNIGSHVVDEAGVKMLSEWILSLEEE